MTISLKHNFVTAKADGTDATLLRPSNWNEEHVLQLAGGNLVGRATTGTGAAEEILCSAAAMTMLAAADIPGILAALGVRAPATGDVQLTLQSTPSNGWVMFDDGTIGNAASGATTRANADALGLFTLLYNSPFTDANAPLLTSTGAATTRATQGLAATAFAAGCRLSLTKMLGRALAIAGSGSGLTTRTVGQAVGEEAHLLSLSETPAGISSNNPSQGITVTGPGTGGMFGNFPGANNGYAPGSVPLNVSNTVGFSGGNNITVTSTNTGGQTHNNMQPTSFLNAMVKL